MLHSFDDMSHCERRQLFGTIGNLFNFKTNCCQCVDDLIQRCICFDMLFEP